MDSTQNQLNVKNKIVLDNQRSFFSRFGLPVLLFISFVWLDLYAKLGGLNSVFYPYKEYGSLSSYLILSVLIYSVADYVIFELCFMLYRLFLSFSIYSFMIPKIVLLDNFRKCYIFRNIILGVVFNLRFLFPYINTYLCVVELIGNFLFIFCLFLSLKKKYVEPLVAHYVFKTLTIPVVLYEAYILVTLMVGVL